MKYQHQIKAHHLRLTKMVGINEPSDGFTDEEKLMARILAENTIHTIFKKLPTTRMKAVAAMLDLGYHQGIIAEIFEVTQEQIALEVSNIKRVLSGKAYKPHKTPHKKELKKNVGVADVLGFIHSIQQP